MTYFSSISIALLFSHLIQANPIISVGESDLVKDTDVFDEVTMSEEAKITTEEITQDKRAPKVQVIIDSSGSMAQILAKNKSKMFFLKELMKPFFKAQWKEKNLVGLRVYGGKAKASCDDSELVVPFGIGNLSIIERNLISLEPIGMTPLHKSLELAFEDLKKYSGPKRVVIVTDGEDTCGGDPCRTADRLSKENLDLKFYVIALGFKGESESLKKVKCIGDTMVADDEESFQESLSQVAAKISDQDNLQVISPNPAATVYLYELSESDKKTLQRVFYANSPQKVPPGRYEAIVDLNPPYKFSNFTIPPKRKITLKVAGSGNLRINFFQNLLNGEVLDQNNKVIKRLKSDNNVQVPTGKWRLRVFKGAFFEQIFPEFYVYPNGLVNFDISGVGVFKVDSKHLTGLYVYDQNNKELGQGLTNTPIAIKSSVYTVHAGSDCSFEKVAVRDRKEVIVLPCGRK